MIAIEVLHLQALRLQALLSLSRAHVIRTDMTAIGATSLALSAAMYVANCTHEHTAAPLDRRVVNC
eukprot:16109-Heterococcus_DN1.PRE.1